MTLVDLVRGLRGRKEAAIESYSSAVARLAADERLPVEQMERTLQSAGKSPEDLQRDVERLKKRLESAERLRHPPDSKGITKALDKRRAQAQAVLDAAEAIYDDALHAIRLEMEALRAEEQVITDAKRYLEDSASEDLVARVRAAERVWLDAGKELSAAAGHCEIARNAVKGAERLHEDARTGRVLQISRHGYIGPEVTESEAAKRLENAKEALSRAESREQAAQDAHRQAERKLADVRAILLIP